MTLFPKIKKVLHLLPTVSDILYSYKILIEAKAKALTFATYISNEVEEEMQSEFISQLSPNYR